mmetsp:Transcript_25542/g.56836  ORF Transcript_25542/g.56836 Transcript_25542/m.56836 type:complete len:916 (-) Transcript_25542:75-2822(-)
MVLPKTRKLIRGAGGAAHNETLSPAAQSPPAQSAAQSAAQSSATPTTATAASYQVQILDKPPATNKNWWDLCSYLGIDMSQSHRICTDVSRGGVAVLGTWIDDGDVGGKGSGSNGGSNGGSKEGGSKKYRKREDVEERLRALGINYRIVPASGDDGEKAVLSGAEEEDEEKEESVEGDKKRRRRVAEGGVVSSAEGSAGGRVDQVASDPAANTSSSSNPPPNTNTNTTNTSSSTTTVNPEIQRLYDANIISQNEYDQMIQADRQFKDETYSVDFTSSSTGGDGSNGGDDNGNNNGGRIPDLYDAYANRLTATSWVNTHIYTQNYTTLTEMSLLEFCRKFSVPRRGRHAGRIKYHRGGYITKRLKFSPVYSSDRTGPDYGKYCRYSLVRYRPWIDAPFGRDEAAEEKGVGGLKKKDTQKKEHEPDEKECIKEWEDFISALKPRMQYVPDLLLPPELRGGGASVDVFLSTEQKDEEEEEFEEDDDDDEGPTGKEKELQEGEVGRKGKDDLYELVVSAIEQLEGESPAADGTVENDATNSSSADLGLEKEDGTNNTDDEVLSELDEIDQEVQGKKKETAVAATTTLSSSPGDMAAPLKEEGQESKVDPVVSTDRPSPVSVACNFDGDEAEDKKTSERVAADAKEEKTEEPTEESDLVVSSSNRCIDFSPARDGASDESQTPSELHESSTEEEDAANLADNDVRDSACSSTSSQSDDVPYTDDGAVQTLGPRRTRKSVKPKKLAKTVLRKVSSRTSKPTPSSSFHQLVEDVGIEDTLLADTCGDVIPQSSWKPHPNPTRFWPRVDLSKTEKSTEEPKETPRKARDSDASTLSVPESPELLFDVSRDLRRADDAFGPAQTFMSTCNGFIGDNEEEERLLVKRKPCPRKKKFVAATPPVQPVHVAATDETRDEHYFEVSFS